MNRSNRDLSRRWESHFRRGLAAAVAIHVLLVLAFRSDGPDSPFSAAGPRAGDAEAAAGEGFQVIAVRPPPPRSVEPIPVPLPEAVVEVELAEPELEPPVIESPTLDLGAGPSAAPGDSDAAGLPEARGSGDGGTTEEGRFRAAPPSPRGLILPPSDRPRSVRGQEVTVWVFVTDAGRVVPDSTRLEPGTGDTRFDRRLKEQAAQWLFEPAKRGAQPVAEWYRYVITL